MLLTQRTQHVACPHDAVRPIKACSRLRIAQRRAILPCASSECFSSSAALTSFSLLRSASGRLLHPFGSKKKMLHFVTAHAGGRSRRRCPNAAIAFAQASKALMVKTQKYRFMTNTRRWVNVHLENTETGTKVFVMVDQGREEDLWLHWGVFRSSLTRWHHPDELVPPGSEFDSGTGAMRSPMALNEAKGRWEVMFDVPKSVAPVQFGLVPYDPNGGGYDGAPRTGRHFTVPVGMNSGEPAPFGAQLVRAVEDTRNREMRYSVNFSIYSKHATGMSLCLVRVLPQASPEDPASPDLLEPAGGYMEIALDSMSNKTGDVWHICLDGIKDVASLCYGWRAEGDVMWENGLRFHAGFILLDPYATLAVPVKLPEAALAGGGSKVQAAVSMDGTALLGSLSDLVSRYDWGYYQPRGQHTLEDSVLLELDVREFTTGLDAAKIPLERQGKFLGVIDRIPDIKSLGATSVLILNVMAGVRGAADRQPVSFFSPDSSLGVGIIEAGDDLREMVQALHDSGIEVLLQVEFCITGEQPEEDSKLHSFQGLDSATYYRPASFVMNTGHPVVRQLVRNSLRHWVESYQVDGFCFKNAENLTQDRDGLVLDAPPICDEIALDPVLRSVKLIAGVSDCKLLPRDGVRGFPHWGVWMEWNTRFIADSYAFWVQNCMGLHSSMATRIAGSPDLFAAQWDANLPGNLACPRRPAFGVNAPTPLASPALLDMLNPPEGEGIGPEAECLARAMLLMTLLSQGLPSFSAQSVSRPGLSRFAAHAIRLRKKYQVLFSPPLFDSPRVIKWHGATEGSQPDWEGMSSSNPGAYAPNYLGFSATSGVEGPIYVGYNPYPEPIHVTLPTAPIGTTWQRLVDTSKLPPEDIELEGSSVQLPPAGATYWVHSRSAVVFSASSTDSSSTPALV